MQSEVMPSSNASLEDFPEHVLLDILSRLPAKTIIHCKCVCKQWRDLVLDPHFANLHLSKARAAIMIVHYSEHDVTYKRRPYIFRCVEIEDEHDHHSLHYGPVTSLDLNLARNLQNDQNCFMVTMGSINGLVCLLIYGLGREKNICVCNPVTREYVILPKPQLVTKGPAKIGYGFGMSSLTGEYKVIRTFKTFDCFPHPIKAEVYTLGTGEWKTLGPVGYSINGCRGAFFNNHLHWAIREDEASLERIYAFDLDKETFQLFPSPPENTKEEYDYSQSLGILKGCLCQSFYNSFRVSVWMMKEYGIKKSWQRELSIRLNHIPYLDWPYHMPFNLVQSLKDGSIMMVYDHEKLLIYHPDTDTIEETEFSEYFLDAISYCPSFLKLPNFESERVQML